MTRSTAGTSWSGRGSWCAPTVARPASTSITIADVEQYGVARLLDELAADLKDGAIGRSRPGGCSSRSPARASKRPLSIPAVRDRVVQAALKIVIEPIFEADFSACSFGFRPKSSAHDALQVLVDESFRGQRGGWRNRISPIVLRRSRMTG